MGGGPRDARDRIAHILTAIAAKYDGQPCAAWIPMAACVWGEGLPAGAEAVCVPIDVQAAEMAAREPAPPGPLARRLSRGRCLRFDTGVDRSALTRLIRAVGAA